MSGKLRVRMVSGKDYWTLLNNLVMVTLTWSNVHQICCYQLWHVTYPV